MQKSNDAIAMDATILLRKEGCAPSTGQRGNYVAVKDAPILFRREECALSMGQRSRGNDAAAKVARTYP